MRVLVIGFKGFFGRRVAEAFSALADCEVWAGGRSSSGERAVKIDLRDETTFPAMNGFDFVVNCADSFKASPHNAIRYALRNHVFFIDTTAEAGIVERILFEEKMQADAGDDGVKGIVMLGMGIFPGLSNMVAAALHRKESVQGHLGLGIQLNALSGAGSGMRSLMIYLMNNHAVHYDDGERIEARPFSQGPKLPFRGDPRFTLKAWFPESSMLHLSIGVPNISTGISISPFFLEPLLRLVSRFLPRQGPLKWVMLRGLGLALTLVRGVALRWRATPIIITARDSHAPEKALSLHVDDGVISGAYAVVAAVSLLAEEKRPEPGVYTPDELIHPESIFGRLNAFVRPPFQLRIEGASVA